MSSLTCSETYRKYKRGTADTTASAKTQATTIFTSDYKRLVEAIATSEKPKVDVPARIIGLLKGVIAGRKWCADCFTRPKTDEKDGHTHFIEALEDVLDTLEPLAKPLGTQRKALSKPPQQDSLAETVLSNLFQYLDIEEPAASETPPTQPKRKKAEITKSTLQESPRKRTVYDPEVLAEDRAVATFSLLRDCNEIIELVKILWSEYRSGRIGLVTASLTTDIAIDIMCRAETDFLTSFPDLSDHGDVLKIMVPYFESLADKPTQRMEFNVANVVSENSELYNTLRNDLLGLQNNVFPVVGDSLIQLDDSMNVAQLSAKEKVCVDVGIYSRAMPDILMLSEYKKRSDLPAKDQITRGLQALEWDPGVPTWLIFAVRIFVELHKILQQDTNGAFRELNDAGQHAKDRLDFLLRYTAGLAPDKNRKNIEDVLSVNSLMFKLDVQHDTALESRKHWFDAESKLPPFYLLAHHPILCGILQFNVRQGLQYGVIKLSNCWAVIISVAHIYNACKQSGYITTPWADMERVISIHTPDKIFVGAPPTEYRTYFTRFCLAIGVSTKVHARDMGQRAQSTISTKIPMSPNGPRELCPGSDLMHAFSVRYLKYDIPERPGHTLHQVEDILGKVTKKHKRAPKLTPRELLAALREHLTNEELHFEFDYLAFNQRCLELLLRLSRLLKTKYPHRDWATEYGESIRCLRLNPVLDFFFKLKDMDQQVDDPSWTPQQGGRPKKRMCNPYLDAAASVIKEVMEEGDLETEKALVDS